MINELKWTGVDLSRRARNLLKKLPELKTSTEFEWNRGVGEDWKGFCELLMVNSINLKKLSFNGL